jgi:hypothetical protein
MIDRLNENKNLSNSSKVSKFIHTMANKIVLDCEKKRSSELCGIDIILNEKDNKGKIALFRDGNLNLFMKACGKEIEEFLELSE